jgi:hypothetical protein
MSDPLLSPTLQDGQQDDGAREPPWRLQSQFWVAFFGGPLAASAIAFFNCRRLRVPSESRRWIFVIAAAALGAAGLLAFVLVAADVGSGARLANQAAGVLAFIPLHRLQKSADRVYLFYGDQDEDDAYESLWGPGLAAVFLLGLPVTLVLSAIVATA